MKNSTRVNGCLCYSGVNRHCRYDHRRPLPAHDHRHYLRLHRRDISQRRSQPINAAKATIHWTHRAAGFVTCAHFRTILCSISVNSAICLYYQPVIALLPMVLLLPLLIIVKRINCRRICVRFPPLPTRYTHQITTSNRPRAYTFHIRRKDQSQLRLPVVCPLFMLCISTILIQSNNQSILSNTYPFHIPI